MPRKAVPKAQQTPKSAPQSRATGSNEPQGRIPPSQTATVSLAPRKITGGPTGVPNHFERRSGYLQLNKTILGRLNQHLPDSNLVDLSQKVFNLHRETCTALGKDPTRTETSRDLASLKSANKGIQQLRQTANHKHKSLEITLNQLVGDVEAKTTVRGTTDSIIRGQMLSILAGKPWAEVMTLLNQGRPEVAEALAMPTSPYLLGFENQPERMTAVQTGVEKACLGPDKYNRLQEARAQQIVLHEYTQDLNRQETENNEAIEHIESLTVPEPTPLN